MSSVLLVIHLIITLALIGVVLIQRSEGGGLGIGTTGGMGSFMGGRGTTNLLTRTTAVLAAIFMALSLTLALLNRGTSVSGRSILDDAPVSAPVVPPTAPAAALPPAQSTLPTPPSSAPPDPPSAVQTAPEPTTPAPVPTTPPQN